MPSTYQLLDFGNGKRLEQWGDIRLVRPDPTATVAPKNNDLWASADAVYEGEKGKGQWITSKPVPDSWHIVMEDLSFLVRLAPYKHTGVFPEQQENWNWMRNQAKNRELRILNLFAYTGGATMALAKDVHYVTHVDSSKPAIAWAKENAELNAIRPNRIRWMLEDAPLFVSRELKRGNFYDGILLDPPAYGHSPSGKTWRIERDLAPLLEECAVLLSDNPAFLVLNGYAQNDEPESFHRLLKGILHAKRPSLSFDIEARELTLRSPDGRSLSTGITARVKFS